LAAFIATSSAALVHPYFYLIWTNTRWSLCVLSGLSPINYSALLLKCQLVNIRTNTADGSRMVQLERKKWIAFLERYELRGDANGKGGCAEFTDGKISHAAIFEDNQYDLGAYTARMPLLRMGKVCQGKCPPSNTAINSGDEQLRLTHAMREVKMTFIEATMSLLIVDKTKQEDISAVEQWVLMTKTTVDSTNDDDGDAESQEQPQRPWLPTPSVTSTVGSQFTTPGPCFDQAQSTQAAVTPERFPGLAKLSPYLCVLQCGEGLRNGFDLNMIHFQQVINDCATYCKLTGAPLQFLHSHGQSGVRLVELTIQRCDTGILKPNEFKCIEEMLSVCEEYIRNPRMFNRNHSIITINCCKLIATV
jgi:hypothetical protein